MNKVLARAAHSYKCDQNHKHIRMFEMAMDF